MSGKGGGDQPKVIRVVKKKKDHSGHHGGSWKVAYADFVTAMMAFFLVMWIMGMEQGVKEMVQGYFNNPIGFKKAQSAGQNILSVANSPANMNVDRLILMSKEYQQEQFEAVRQQIEEKLAERPDLQQLAAQLEMLITDEGLRIELVEDAEGQTFFPFASSELKPAAERLLLLIGPELDALNNGIVLEGHTDAVPFGRSNYSNWELSTDRAHAARAALEDSGYRSTKILEVRGYADRNPRIDDDPFDPRNRRISMLLPFQGDMAPSIQFGSPAAEAPVNVSHETE
ncbi:MAG: flagellar motor protein MotB [Gemmatimonadota bacterium]